MRITSPISSSIPSNFSSPSLLLIAGLSISVVASILLTVLNVPQLAQLVPVLLAGLVGTVAVRTLRSSFRLQTAELLEFQKNRQLNLSARRVLDAVRSASSASTSNADEILANGIRTVSGLQAAFTFRLIPSDGVFSASGWSADKDMARVRQEFEALDVETPGIQSVKQGSALVLSGLSTEYEDLPAWAEDHGFTTGLVAPIVQGLNTQGFVYAFTNRAELPSLAEIEQVELFLGLYSKLGLASDVGRASARNIRVPVEAKHTPHVEESPAVQIDGLALNPTLGRLTIEDHDIALSPIEAQLVGVLASSAGKPVSAETLLEQCWDGKSGASDNSVDVAIFRLRKKLSKAPAGKSLIKTVRGAGYMLLPPRTNGEAPVIAD
jgi:DNA-binding winged helix-turn-helix (wHTH) protein